MKRRYCIPLSFIILLSGQAFSQRPIAFPSLTYPHSIFAGGMGEQGVTIAHTPDAMEYNPANLIRIKDATVSFYRNPWMQWRWPLTSVSLSLQPSHTTRLGFAYTDWDRGTVPITTEEFPDGAGESWHIYERSIAGALAVALDETWAVGAEFRYAWSSLGSLRQQHVVFSAGASYVPNERTHFGLSLMNFGTPAENNSPPIMYYGPEHAPLAAARNNDLPEPARLHLGADYALVHHRLFDMTFALGFTKPLDQRDEEPIAYATRPGSSYQGSSGSKSSWTSLFSAWSNFPEDVTTHIGFAWSFRPLPLGGGISFFQESYLGYFSVGTSSSYYSLFTHGIRAGIDVSGVKLSAGYAGKWHDNRRMESYIFFDNLSETFQFDVSADLHARQGTDRNPDAIGSLSNILVSGGYLHCEQVGNMKGLEIYGGRLAFRMPTLWIVGSDFYMSNNSAILASFGYGRMVESIEALMNTSYSIKISEEIETIYLESGFRYHPIGAFHPLFVQASLGITRFNPVNDYSGQRHAYYSYDRLVLGCVLPLGDSPVFAMPSVGLRTIFMENYPDIDKLDTYNQFEFGVNMGYTF